MAGFGVSMTVFVPKAVSGGRHGKDLSMKRSAPLGGHGMLLYGTVSTGLAA